MINLSFKELAKRHQIKFREKVLRVGYDGFETILTDEDAQKGLIFFDGFKITEYAQTRYPHFKMKQACFANMLRSEHIPFNFFVPLSRNTEFARGVLNKFMGGVINTITDLKIDYAPNPDKALMDNTSFDVYIEYRHASGGYGIIAFEVKYTERESRLMKDSKEAKEINQENSVYYSLTEKTGLYRKEKVPQLKNDKYRQVWKNHLLGESMTRKNHPGSKYEYFTSIILYPYDNEHFRELVPEYKSFLHPGLEKSFIGITYEEFIDAAAKLTDDKDFIRWAHYLKTRYIIGEVI